MEPREFFGRLRREEPGEFAGFFHKMEKSAFRLEMLGAYCVPQEVEKIKQFRSGQIVPPQGSNQKWIDILAAATNRNVDFQRVRLYKHPISDYLKFEVAWGYRLNVPAGEKTFCIKYETDPLFENQVPILKDFWLFDDKNCFLMEYDFLGRFLGVSVVPEDLTGPYVLLKLELLHKAKPVQETELWEFAQ